MFTLQAFAEMNEMLDRKIRRTPLIYSDYFSELSGHDVYLKAENLQILHSFKVRSAYGGLLPKLEAARKMGVVTSSSGNFAQSIAFAGRDLGVQVTVVMMERSAKNKVEVARRLGAEVVFCPNDFSERLEIVEKLSKEQGKLIVHSFDDEGTIRGNGTLGFDLLQQLPDADVVVIPTSGGGLLAGVSAVMKQSGSRARILGAQTEAIPSLKVSLDRGEPTTVPNAPTIADGLVGTRPGRLNFDLVKQYVDDVLLVSDDDIIQATVRLIGEDKLVVEPSGAAGVAAFVRHPIKATGRLKIVLVLTGGNVRVGKLRNFMFAGDEFTLLLGNDMDSRLERSALAQR
jgi:threonine dehydratase